LSFGRIISGAAFFVYFAAALLFVNSVCFIVGCYFF
jgi:hypothetical protein